MLRRTHGGQPRKIEAIRSYLAQFGHRPGQRIVRDVAGKIASERVASHRDWLRPNARCAGSSMAIRPTVCVVSAESAGRIRRACLSRAVETEDRRKVRGWTLRLSIQVIQTVFLASWFGKPIVSRSVGQLRPGLAHCEWDLALIAYTRPARKGSRLGDCRLPRAAERAAQTPPLTSQASTQTSYHLVN